MNTENRVFNKLAQAEKVELSAQKVELALELGGIKSMASKLKTNIKSYQKKFSVLDDLVGEISSEAKELDGRVDNFYKEVKAIEVEGKKSAKELGVNFFDTPIGKEVNSINTSILIGELGVIKEGLKIKIK